MLVTFELPRAAATFGVRIGGLECTVAYTPRNSSTPAAPPVLMPVACGGIKDKPPYP